MTSAFNWRGQGCELLNNFAGINTETVKPADKTRKIQRGSMR